jgi:hypothetical protein
MASKELDELIKKAEELTSDEQLLLIARLVEGLREAQRASRPRRKWREISGSVSYPLLGEDAQDWVSRTRREGDEHRERQWGHKQ